MAEERKPTGEEIRQKMKEEYKKDLRARKEFRGKVEELRKQQKLTKAIVEITEAGNDDSDVWIDQLNQETALNEAKTEMAIDSVEIAAEEAKKEEAFAMSEAEMEKIKAAEMVAQMKAQMAGESDVQTPKVDVEAKAETEAPAVEEVEAPDHNDHRPARKMMDDI